MTTNTATPRTRASLRDTVLNAAVTLAVKRGLRGFSRSDVAREANVAGATVSYHFTMDELRKEVVNRAIDREFVSILADARADRESAQLFTGMSADLKKKVAAYIAR